MPNHDFLRLTAAALYYRLAQFCRWFMHRHVENIGLTIGLAVTVAISYGLYLFDPRTPSLSLATVQVLTLAPVFLFLVLHTTVWTYKYLFPAPFKQLMGALGDKLTLQALPRLEDLLPPNTLLMGYPEVADAARLRMHYHLLAFLIRCTRYVLFALPFCAIFYAMQEMLKLALNLQPH